MLKSFELCRIDNQIFYVDTGGKISYSILEREPNEPVGKWLADSKIMDVRTNGMLLRHGRSDPRYARKNYEIIGALLVRHMGKPLDTYYAALEKRLQSLDREAASAKLYRDAHRRVKTPAETDEPSSAPVPPAWRRTSQDYTIDDLEKRRRSLAEGSVLIYGGIVDHRRDHSGFEVRYVLRHSIPRDRKWELATKHRRELCQYAFDCIRASATEKGKLDRSSIYIPTNMHLNDSGELYIEFTRREKKAET